MSPDRGADNRRRPSPFSLDQPLVSVEEIQKAADEERQRRLTTDKWKAAYENVSAQEPLLVLGDQRAYYLVEFRKDADSTTTALMIVSPVNAKIGSVMTVEKPGEKIRFFRGTQIPELLHERVLLVPTREDFPPAKRVKLDKDGITLQLELYWDPCDQSLTPFKPFYVAEFWNQRNVRPNADEIVRGRLFVRVDGEVYTQITFGGGGM